MNGRTRGSRNLPEYSPIDRVRLTSRDLRKGVIYSSRLKNVQASRWISQFDPLEEHQCRHMPSTSFSIAPRQTIDFDGFQEAVLRRKTAARRLETLPWIKHTVTFFLGPEQMRMYEQKGIGKLAGRRHTVLTYNSLPTYVLLVETNHDKHKTKFLVNYALGSGSSGSEECLIALPQSDYVLKLRHGKSPEIITDCRATKNLLVLENALPPGSAIAHYEDLLRCSIRSTRLLSLAEILSLEKRLQQVYTNQSIRLLEFFKLEDRERAEKELLTIPVMFLDTNPEEVFEECSLSIDYDARLRPSSGVSCKLADERDKVWALKVFNAHNLRKRGDEDFDEHLERTIFLSNFPHHYWHFSDRKWLVEKVCANNDIPIERISPLPVVRKNPTEAHLDARHQQIFQLVNEQLAFLSEDVDSWHVQKVEERSCYQVHFKAPQIGLEIIARMMERRRAFCLVDTDAEVTPIYRCSFQINRRIRASYERTIRQMDIEFREYFAKLSDLEHESMTVEEAQFYSMRLFERWDDDSDIGLLGVEGWSDELVREHLDKLKTELEPIKFQSFHCSQLFSGVGEQYALSLQEKYEGELVVDVDKFGGVISLFGSRAANAFRDLQDYEGMKQIIEIRTTIPAYRPFFNSSALLGESEVYRMAIALGAFLRLDEKSCCMEFTGSIEAYETLKSALDEISTEVFDGQTARRVEKIRFECPVCFTTEIPEDFFRLNCGHTYCRECANGKVKADIDKSKFDIECDAESCKGFWKPEEILTFVLGGANRMVELDSWKLKKLSLRARKAALQKNMNAAECHLTVDCLGILFRSDTLENKNCGMCNAAYCSSCFLAPHDGALCEEALQSRAIDASVLEFVANLEIGEEDTLQCPKCMVIVMRDAGCDHMPCACGAHFCWHCRATFETELECHYHLHTVHFENIIDEPFPIES